MKFYGIDVQGYLKLRKYDNSLPAYTASDSRRLAYVYNRASTGEDAIYLGGESGSQWTRVVLDDGADYPNLQSNFDGVYHPLHGSGALNFYAQIYGGVGGSILMSDSVMVLDCNSDDADVSICRNSIGGSNVSWNNTWYASVGNQFNGTPVSGGWWTVFNTSDVRGGGVATENWVDGNFVRVGEALGGGALDDYYTKSEANGRYVASTDAATRNIDQWTDCIVWNEGATGPLPSNAVHFSKVAESGGVYSNTEGANMTVKRTSVGDIYARYGRLTAITSQYADLAEKYTCDPEVIVGTVVGVSDNLEYEVEPFNINMNGCIGVVSEKPALLMNEGSQGQAIALTGKVPVRVIGEIEKGDFLVPCLVGLAKKGDPTNSDDVSNKFGISLETSLLSDERMVICIIK